MFETKHKNNILSLIQKFLLSDAINEINLNNDCQILDSVGSWEGEIVLSAKFYLIFYLHSSATYFKVNVT